jgi:anaerobic magnesium-protoporphyrin IX monomethyl ester cyclase
LDLVTFFHVKNAPKVSSIQCIPPIAVLNVVLLQIKDPVDVDWHASLSFGYLKSYLDRFFQRPLLVRIADHIQEALSWQPDVLGISCYSQDFLDAETACRQAREAGVPWIILGGMHITAFPEMLPPFVDVGVIGEGEETFCELLNEISTSGEAKPGRLNSIPGIVYWDRQGLLQSTPIRMNPLHLDQLPIPDRRFIHRGPGQTPHLFTSRGCPYRCSFCSSAHLSPKLRVHGAARIFEEIRLIRKEYPETQSLFIWDNLFIVNRRRLIELSDLLQKDTQCSNLKLAVAVRAELVDEELCRILGRLKVTHAGLGIESGTNTILKKLKDPHSSVESNQAALDLLFDHGIKTWASFIIGHYEESETDVLATYNFLLDNYAQGKISGHDMNILTPLPKTPLWDWALANGYVSNRGFAWNRLRYTAVRSNNLQGNIQQWIDLRSRNQSLYLDEQNVPLMRLYEIIALCERKIDTHDYGQVSA